MRYRLYISIILALMKIVHIDIEGPEGVKWELPIFWLRKWDFIHWDWDSSTKKQYRKREWD